MWDSENELAARRDYRNGVISSSKLGVKIDGFEQRGKSWYVAADIPSDLLVQIGDASFHLHKYPLLSRSGKMNRLIYESGDTELDKIVLDDLPGGPEAFELAAKFCYGIAVDLAVTNISGLRCAAEYLEMTEDLEEGNLIFKTEAFLSYVVLSSWRDSIIVLKSCEKLSPWAENLQIVRRCSESIAWKACANPKGIRWAYTGKVAQNAISSPKWNETKDRDSSGSPSSRNQQVPPDWWFEDVSILRIDHFVRVITAIKVKGMRFELIGAVITHHAAKWLPGLAKDGMSSVEEVSNGSWKGGLQLIVAGTKDELTPTLQAKDQRMIIESLISIIPPQKDSVSCGFLLRLLRMANMLKVAPALVTELEKRVGMQFEQATAQDLLMPCYDKGGETLYDVDLVQRLLEHFLVHEQTEGPSPGRQTTVVVSDKTNNNAKMRVARLVDSYLTEVSRDRNLSLTKFQVLAEALPEAARTCDDGLYRAIDSYLKAHPTLSEHERKRICRVMDCQKLSIDARMHAAQNERLPMRVVVQVLLAEQVKISNAIANTPLNLKETGHEFHNSHRHQPLISNRKLTLLEGTPQSFQEGWAAAKGDINTLKFEIESVKAKYLELQNEMENLQRHFDKSTTAKPKQTSAWTSGWKKLSKLTKMTALETNDDDIGPQNPNLEHNRKAHRRWRNSIS